MTAEEIKAQKSMSDILVMYGLQPNRSNFIPCPFHQGDREASCKIYQDSFYCFACGTTGDIFTFIQLMNHVSFKEAFQILGGSYPKPSFTTKYKIEKAKREREQIQKREEQRKKERELNQTLITVYRAYLKRFEPLSDEWTECYNALQYQLYVYEYVTEKR